VIALAFLVLVVGLFAWGVWARRHHGGDVTSTYRTTLAILAAGAATAIIGSWLPVYVILRRSMLGGTTGENLPPGASEDLLLNLVTVGGIITIVAAVNRLIDHSKSD
jgi:hypothetical protein